MSIGTQVDSRDIRKIVMEGGGGKALVYSGVIKALQAIGKLPAHFDSAGEDNNVDMIGGASGGAITCFFLALRCTAEDIDELTNQMGKYSLVDNANIKQKDDINRFVEFYDLPEVGLYKAVKYVKHKDKEGGINTPMFANDKLDDHKQVRKTITTSGEDQYKTTNNVFGIGRYIKQHILSQFLVGLKYEETKGATDINSKYYRKGLRVIFFSIKQLYNMLRASVFVLAWKAINGTRKEWINSETYMIALLMSKPSLFEERRTFDYFTSLLNDRGLFSGIKLRAFLVETAIKLINKKFLRSYTEEEVSLFTFKQLFEITNVKLKLAGCNLSKNIPVEFSADESPDLPIIDCVCASMAIPFIFKPIHFDAIADMKRAEDDPHNMQYKGLFIDGGTLNNLPIHTYDIKVEMEMQDYLKSFYAGTIYENRDYGPITATQRLFDPTILPIRVQGGVQPSDWDYWKDPMYQAFIGDKKNVAANKALTERSDGGAFLEYLKKNYKSNGKTSTMPFDPILIKRKGLFSIFTWTAENLIGTLMYYGEEGQLRTPYEIGHALTTYSYDISVFDFAPDEKLKQFAYKRAFIKTIMKFSDIWDAKTQEFVIDPTDPKYVLIGDALELYDPSFKRNEMSNLFKKLYPFLK